MNNIIIYEQPLNEHIRASLRLEHLFKMVRETIEQPSPWASQVALQSFMKILNVVDRPDLKNKLTKALSQHATVLTQLEALPQIDREKLRTVLETLDAIIDKLYVLNSKFAQRLFDNDFLSSIRSHMHNPGGPCSFSIPAYHLWLNQDPEYRQTDLIRWFEEFALLEHTITLLLRLTRDFAKAKRETAISGFYQQSLDPNAQGELLQIKIPGDLNVYPETSTGRHRLSVRFYELNLGEKPKQTAHDIEFTLLYSSL